MGLETSFPLQGCTRACPYPQSSSAAFAPTGSATKPGHFKLPGFKEQF